MAWKITAASFFLVAWLIVSAMAWHYRQQADHWRQVARQERSRVSQMTERQQRAEILDRKHTEALANAQNEIDQLRSAVSAGAKRVRVHAACQPAAASASGVDDAATARLTKNAERNYIRLRQQIATITAQVNGLQDYINSLCLRKTP